MLKNLVEIQHFENGTSILVDEKEHVILAERHFKNGKYIFDFLDNLSTGEKLFKNSKVFSEPEQFVFNPEKLVWILSGTAKNSKGEYKNPKGPFFVTDDSKNPEQFKALKNFLGGRFKYKYSDSTLWGYWSMGDNIIGRRNYDNKRKKK